MRAVTIREAKAHLNELIEAATRGEEVVLMRGSKHVAAIIPISADDIELSPRLTDAQAERFWRQIAAERAAGSVLSFDSPEEAVAHLASARKAPARKRRRVAASRGSRRRS